jgi:hypothetical protein
MTDTKLDNDLMTDISDEQAEGLQKTLADSDGDEDEEDDENESSESRLPASGEFDASNVSTEDELSTNRME